MGLNIKYRGHNNYQYYFRASILYLEYNGPQHPILSIKALHYCVVGFLKFLELRV